MSFVLACMVTAIAAAAVASGATALNAAVVGIARTTDGQGYWLVAADGGVFAFGNARFYGSEAGTPLSAPVVGMAATPDGKGYWLVASDGGVFAFGDAQFHGSEGGMHLNAPVAGIAATPDRLGYWLVAGDGGVFAFGDAHYYGSESGTKLNQPVVGIAATPDGLGYWMAAGDGGVFGFGDAHYYGSEGGTKLNAPVVGIGATPDGLGYWLVAGDGGVFNFGDAQFYGSLAGTALNAPVVGMAASAGGKGYWLTAGDGGVFSYGDSVFHSSLPAQGPPPPPILPPPSRGAPPIPGGSSLSQMRQQVVNVAFSQEGYQPSRDGCTRYSPAVCRGGYAYGEWCSVFATWIWEQAGVPIPIYAYSGDPYTWAGGGTFKSGGSSPAHTYVVSSNATPAPGDLVFFGSGPRNSAHVAVVTQVLPDGALVTMNGNDSTNAVGPSTFFPPHEAGLPPVYGYASPVMDSGAVGHARVPSPATGATGAPALTATMSARTTTDAVTLTPQQLKRLLSHQDPPSYKRALSRAARAHPAFEHMPFRGRQITVEIANYLRSGKIVIDALYRTTRHAAVRDLRGFLHRYHDPGRAYVVHYQLERKIHSVASRG